jgi:hypothetical protein
MASPSINVIFKQKYYVPLKNWNLQKKSKSLLFKKIVYQKSPFLIK